MSRLPNSHSHSDNQPTASSPPTFLYGLVTSGVLPSSPASRVCYTQSLALWLKQLEWRIHLHAVLLHEHVKAGQPIQ